MSEMIAYEYHSSGEPGDDADFLVRPYDASAETGSHWFMATHVQEVIADALERQYDGIYTSSDIRHTADSLDTNLVREQAENLGASGGDYGPIYFTAKLTGESIGSLGGMFGPVVGVGKAGFADGRKRSQRDRDASDTARANLADIGDVYVGAERMQPNSRELLARRGIGSALVHQMLGRYDPDMETVVYDFPKVNPLAINTLRRYGFRASKGKRGMEPWCGHQVRMTQFRGPAVGELQAELVKRHQWLAEREQIA